MQYVVKRTMWKDSQDCVWISVNYTRSLPGTQAPVCERKDNLKYNQSLLEVQLFLQQTFT